MRNLLFFIAVMCILLSFTIPVNAFDWHSEEGAFFLLNEDYQISKSIDACVARYGSDQRSVISCSANMSDCYDSTIGGIILFIEAMDLGLDVDEGASCIENALNKYWNTSTNTANWVAVDRYVANCISNLP